MFVIDFGAELLGKSTAQLIRAISLFDTGVTSQQAADVLDWDLDQLEAERDRLTTIGILHYDSAVITINRRSAQWPGVAAILDARAQHLLFLSVLAEQLAGPGTRVALYGAPVETTRQFLPEPWPIMIRATGAPLELISLRDEIIAMIPGGQMRLAFPETTPPTADIIATSNAATINNWLHGTDLFDLGTDGATIAAANREILVSRYPDKAANRADDIPSSGEPAGGKGDDDAAS